MSSEQSSPTQREQMRLTEVGDGRPEDCSCTHATAGANISCWPCYRDGFGSPNPRKVRFDEEVEHGDK